MHVLGRFGFVVLLFLATSCSTTPASTSEATDVGTVSQPAPGVDVDRDKAIGQVVDAQGMSGWYPHEGSLMKYRVAIRFGQEPSSMPEGWNFGRVSSVATDSDGQVFVFHRGETADPIIVFDSDAISYGLLGVGCSATSMVYGLIVTTMFG